jgi:NAD(P)-dependent dehydrogenase (short-subunit alcohol dehydrogenase family)
MPTKSALITGASRRLGIGFATARHLAEQGYHVILTARDVRQAEQLTAELRQSGHNASSWPDSDTLSPLAANLTEARTAFDVDVLGPWRLIQALLPLLERAPAARIVSVSSEAALQIDPHRTAHDGFLRAPGYSLAKYTMNVLTTLLAPALADTAILINSVDPGETASHPDRGDEDTARPAAESARGIVWAATLPVGGPTGGLFRDGQPLGDADSVAL